MTWPIWYGNKILFSGGSFAMSTACCCGDPPLPDCCFLDEYGAEVKLDPVTPISNASATIERSDGSGGSDYFNYSQAEITSVGIDQYGCVTQVSLRMTNDEGTRPDQTMTIEISEGSGQGLGNILMADAYVPFLDGAWEDTREVCGGVDFTNGVALGSGRFEGSFTMNCIPCEDE